MDPEQLLTLQELAVELRCSKSHVSNILNGRVRGLTPLSFIPVGRRKLVKSSTLERWKTENEHMVRGGKLQSSSIDDERGRMEGTCHA
jgi:hypothetical protein